MRMSGRIAPRAERCIGIIDLGSNSLRLLIVRIHADGSTTVLNQVKHMVRLGEGGFVHNRLQDEAMNRTLGVLRGLAEMCAVYETSEIVAIATAAVRDAENGQDFILRVREKTGIDFTAVSGREEARLIYLGVSSGLERSDKLRLFIDIGGGSTELIVGNSQEYRNLDSVKLGCVRLTNLFFKGSTGPVSPREYAALQAHIRNAALHSFQRIADFDIEEAVASSGTAQNLAEIAAAREDADAVREGRPSRASRHVLSYDGLIRAVRELCSLGLEARREIPGINPNRADVLIAGAAILQTVMEEQGFESVTVSGRNLQNGILVDYLMRMAPEREGTALPSREESVLQLARFCRFEEKHAFHVAKLALELFDSAGTLGMNSSPPVSRELLYYAYLSPLPITMHTVTILSAIRSCSASLTGKLKLWPLWHIFTGNVRPKSSLFFSSLMRIFGRMSACFPYFSIWRSVWTRVTGRSCARPASPARETAGWNCMSWLPKTAPLSLRKSHAAAN